MSRSRIVQALLQGSVPSRVALLCGAFTTLLGLLVMVGWYTQSFFLLQIHPTYAPMPFNAGLAFLLTGIGLLLLIDGRDRWISVPAVLVGLTAGLTLLQDIFSFNLGIDELFVRHYVSVGEPHPGRMGPNAALCFLLAAGAIHIPVLLGSGRRTDILDALMGSVVAAFGLAAFAGYLVGIESAYAWGSQAPMAAHSSVGFLLLGIGIVAFDWAHEERAPVWVPVPVAVGVITATLVVWLGLVQRENAHALEVIQSKAVDARRQVEQHVKTRIQALVRMRTRWEVAGGIPKEEWESDALLNLRDFPGYQAIEWADADLRIRWVMPVPGNEAAVGEDLRDERAELGALDRAVTRKIVAISRTRDLPQGGRGFVAYIPLTPDWRFDGLVLGVFHPQQLLDALLLDVAAGYRVSVLDNGEEIYRNTPPGPDPSGGRWTQTVPVTFFDATWQLRLSPSLDVLASLRTVTPEVVLAVGLLLTALLSLTVFFVEERRRQDLLHDLHRTENALNRLMENINDAVYSVDARTKEFRYVSPAFRRLLGYSLDDIHRMGGRVPFLRRVIQNDAFQAQDEAMERMRRGETVTEDRIESWFQCKDGTLRCFEDHWIPVWENGRLISTDGVMRDITERKRSEEIIHEQDDEIADKDQVIANLESELTRLRNTN